MKDDAAFFEVVRPTFGPLQQSQVDGFETLLHEFDEWPLAHAAYGLATAWHETNAKMQPVREAYWLNEDWRKEHLKYYPWYGRGYVQLTWEHNYQLADKELGLDGTLIANPDRALEPDIAAEVMARGMREGWFSGKKLADYLPPKGGALMADYMNARRIINGTDRAQKVAGYAHSFEIALRAGGWA